MTERIAVASGVRTPFCKMGTQLAAIDADQLGVIPLREALLQAKIRPNEVDDVIVGCCGQPAHAANVGRVIALNAGIPEHVPAVTVHRNCASGMEALSTAAQRLLLGEADIIVTAGVESMSNYPLLFGPAMKRFFERLYMAKTPAQRLAVLASFRLRHLAPVMALQVGLTDPTCGLIMGQTAENIASLFNISRLEQDEWANTSHHRAAQAMDAGYLNTEIVPVYPDQNHTSNEPIMADNGPRANQTIEALQKLKPYFDRRFGTVTVGSSSQLTDGAGAMVLMRESTAKARGLRPLGYISGYAYAGCDPKTMGLGPVFSTHKLFKKYRLSMADVDLMELNEAFAAQVLGNVRAFESEQFARDHLNDTTALGAIDTDRLNVNGGAIALGHPLAATGQRIVMTLLYELRRRDQRRGLATLCIGGGQGASFYVEAGE